MSKGWLELQHQQPLWWRNAVISPPSSSPSPLPEAMKKTSAYNQEKAPVIISKVKNHKDNNHLHALLVLCPYCLGIHLSTPKAACCEYLELYSWRLFTCSQDQAQLVQRGGQKYQSQYHWESRINDRWGVVGGKFPSCLVPQLGKLWHVLHCLPELPNRIKFQHALHWLPPFPVPCLHFPTCAPHVHLLNKLFSSKFLPLLKTDQDILLRIIYLREVILLLLKFMK